LVSKVIGDPRFQIKFEHIVGFHINKDVSGRAVANVCCPAGNPDSQPVTSLSLLESDVGTENDIKSQPRAQLPLRGAFHVVNGSLQLASLPETNDAQRESEYSQKAVSDLEPPPKNGPGPVLGSLFSALIGIAVAFPLGVVGIGVFDSQPTIRALTCLLIAVFLAFTSTIGLLVGLDIWSLMRLLIS
jgi:hypothetical protein